MKYGNIIIEQTANPLGVETLTYTWEGPPVTFVSLDLANDLGFKREGDIVKIGPYKLRIVEYSYEYQKAEVVRVDYPFWWWLVIIHRSSKWFRIVYGKTIITLAVWGLADYHPAIIPGYMDIHIIQKVSKWIKRQA